MVNDATNFILYTWYTTMNKILHKSEITLSFVFSLIIEVSKVALISPSSDKPVIYMKGNLNNNINRRPPQCMQKVWWDLRMWCTEHVISCYLREHRFRLKTAREGMELKKEIDCFRIYCGLLTLSIWTTYRVIKLFHSHRHRWIFCIRLWIWSFVRDKQFIKTIAESQQCLIGINKPNTSETELLSTFST